MNRTGGVRRSQVAAVLAAVSLVATGCSSRQDDAAEDAAETRSTATTETKVTAGPTETATEEPSAPGPITTVIFDGDGCRYDGPTELPAGMVTLQFVNDGDRDAFVQMAKLRDGVTLEDVRASDLRRLDNHLDDPVNDPAVYDPEHGSVGYNLAAGDENRYFRFLAVAGDWVLSCGVFIPWSSGPTWLVGGVSVTE